ncbi:MAG: hypothetical protein M0Q13_10605 [Methanothrix sp.]|nr:hypothetical protein [Methanothrix sp.]
MTPDLTGPLPTSTSAYQASQPAQTTMLQIQAALPHMWRPQAAAGTRAVQSATLRLHGAAAASRRMAKMENASGSIICK